MKYSISLLFATFVCCCLNAQQMNGVVYGSDQNSVRTTLPAANVYWEGMQQGVTTDANGKFSIDIPQSSSVERNLQFRSRLIASFIGYQNDTIDISAGMNQVEFVLTEGVMLDETIITARRRGNYLSRITPIC